jgi:hypothetical protein
VTPLRQPLERHRLERCRSSARDAGSLSSVRLSRRGLAGCVGAALAILFATALIAGCGGSGSSDTTDTVLATPVGAHTTKPADTTKPATHTTQTASTPRRIPTTASTTTSPSGSTPGSTHAASGAQRGHLLRRYAGNGNTRLGTVVVRSPSTLVWSAQHPPSTAPRRPALRGSPREPTGVCAWPRTRAGRSNCGLAPPRPRPAAVGLYGRSLWVYTGRPVWVYTGRHVYASFMRPRIVWPP